MGSSEKAPTSERFADYHYLVYDVEDVCHIMPRGRGLHVKHRSMCRPLGFSYITATRFLYRLVMF